MDAFNPDAHDPNTDKLFKILSKAEAVLGCRVSPKQKRDVVELVKRRVNYSHLVIFQPF